uniref:Uncharacterized protein n=1 Tax=Gadus morhua TaxID=8049 RepID=A0A8C5C8X2_GADMO
MHVPVHRLLLPVERLFQHQLRELVPVALRLDVQVKVVIVRDRVGVQRVGAYVRVKRVLHRKTGPGNGALRYLHTDVRLRKTGRVVVDIHHLDLHPKELQWALQKHLQLGNGSVQEAGQDEQQQTNHLHCRSEVHLRG